MTYVTRNFSTKEPTAWKEKEDCHDEWARVKELREDEFGLAAGGRKCHDVPRNVPRLSVPPRP